MVLTLAQLCRRIGVENPCPSLSERTLNTFLTDSRSLVDAGGTVFFALSTDTNDGCRYIPWLFAHGVRTFVVNAGSELPAEITRRPDVAVIEVDDSMRALRDASRHTPDIFSGEMIAVTGSRGKTVLKEWLYQLLEPMKRVVRSPRSFNSRIGVPLSLALIEPGTDIAIIEAGVSRRGEMEILRETILPDTVILTNVGDEHDDGFESRADKIAEKVSLARGADMLIYSADDSEVDEYVRRTVPSERSVRWSTGGVKGVDYRFKVERDTDGTYSLIYTESDTEPVRVWAPNRWDIENACNALAYMLSHGYGLDVIRDGFARLHPIATRLNVISGSYGCNLVYDSYTSDISSMEPALDFIARRRMPSQSMTVIMSDIRHGGNSDEGMNRIAEILKRRGVRRFIGIGEQMCAGREFFDVKPGEAGIGWDGLRPVMACEFYPTTEDFLKSRSATDFHSEIILLKGAPEYGFGRILEVLEARTHETVLEVNLDAMTRNFNYFRSKVPAGVGVIAMVKASGYGAGSYETAKTLQDAGAAYLAVAVLDEGVDLRNNGITMPIMVMNPRVANYKMMFANRLEPEIYTFSMLDDVIDAARRNGIRSYPIHIKLDTGMHRMGFVESEIDALMERINSVDEVRIATVFSHLATADCLDMDDYTESQLSTFERCTNSMLSLSRHHFKRHILNSAGILRYGGEYHYDYVRLGIGLYGVSVLPEPIEKPLELVSSLRTVIISLRDREAGETIGYGRRGVLKRASRIATIPIGYADGMNRHFGNGAINVLVNGKEAPTVGNICMDACMIDVTGIDCREGDTVEIFSPRTGVQHLADLLGTIPYEILTSVSPRVKRVYYRE
ncbi:MAG: bifunctional UDP-N-acetylmuramoyl-tripeptide:D-alanyl-D-alanine ligase/alanine racemase [Muribaculaceae bacterium]|nr:bifunctional UDP-N-acetylmuramoyl-tripeptide:D-alanyl-D-alanine ligase/alanine racemase [Muribaculaceae bacterium]